MMMQPLISVTLLLFLHAFVVSGLEAGERRQHERIEDRKDEKVTRDNNNVLQTLEDYNNDYFYEYYYDDDALTSLGSSNDSEAASSSFPIYGTPPGLGDIAVAPIRSGNLIYYSRDHWPVGAGLPPQEISESATAAGSIMALRRRQKLRRRRRQKRPRSIYDKLMDIDGTPLARFVNGVSPRHHFNNFMRLVKPTEKPFITLKDLDDHDDSSRESRNHKQQPAISFLDSDGKRKKKRGRAIEEKKKREIHYLHNYHIPIPTERPLYDYNPYGHQGEGGHHTNIGHFEPETQAHHEPTPPQHATPFSSPHHGYRESSHPKKPSSSHEQHQPHFKPSGNYYSKPKYPEIHNSHYESDPYHANEVVPVRDYVSGFKPSPRDPYRTNSYHHKGALHTIAKKPSYHHASQSHHVVEAGPLHVITAPPHVLKPVLQATTVGSLGGHYATTPAPVYHGQHGSYGGHRQPKLHQGVSSLPEEAPTGFGHYFTSLNDGDSQIVSHNPYYVPKNLKHHESSDPYYYSKNQKSHGPPSTGGQYHSGTVHDADESSGYTGYRKQAAAVLAGYDMKKKLQQYATPLHNEVDYHHDYVEPISVTPLPPPAAVHYSTPPKTTLPPAYYPHEEKKKPSYHHHEPHHSSPHGHSGPSGHILASSMGNRGLKTSPYNGGKEYGGGAGGYHGPAYVTSHEEHYENTGPSPHHGINFLYSVGVDHGDGTTSYVKHEGYDEYEKKRK